MPSTNENKNPARFDLRSTAAATAVVIAIVAIAALSYLLIDILLLFFIGVVVAAALQPWHAMLCRWNVPRGVSVLLIYLLLFLALAAIALVVGPVVVEQVSKFGSELPSAYDRTRTYLGGSGSAPLHFLAQRLPPFERLAQLAAGMAPRFFVNVTTSVLSLPAYFVSVLAIAFYWTIELPQFERLVLSLIEVEKRPRALNVWHEIESRLGGFIRGQGLAMLSIGLGSAAGYLLIGLPNVLALGVLAGLLEAVPLIGPSLAVAPAVLVALPMGVHTALLVIGLAVLLQLIENNVLIPRIMHSAVGVSNLVSLMAVLAFGTLYGVVGVLIAIPTAAVIQVLLDTLLINDDFATEPAGILDSPWDDLRARVASVGEHARARLRSRTSRMGIDPASTDHVVDAVDQQIEGAAERAEKLLDVAQNTWHSLNDDQQRAILGKLQCAAEQMENAVALVEKISAADDGDGASAAAAHVPSPATQASQQAEHAAGRAQQNIPDAALREAIIDQQALIDDLDRAAQRLKLSVEEVEVLIVDAARGADNAP